MRQKQNRQGLTRREAVLAAAAGVFATSAHAAPASATSASRATASAPVNPIAFDVAVVGAGVFGAWAAWHLKKSGKNVVLIDQYSAGHARSSSGGESRVIRISYGGDPLYSTMSEYSLGLWNSLSARQSQPIFHRTGVLWFSPQNDRYMQSSIAYLEAHGIAHWQGAAQDLRSSYPQMHFDDGEAGFLEQNSGTLIAGRGVQAVVDDAGLGLVRWQAGAIQRDADGIYILGDGIAARSVVYACGPWLPTLFPELLGGKITPTRQQVFHFGARPGDRRFSSPALPAWADFNNGSIVYGIPDLEGQGFKIAFDEHGEIADPDTLDRRVSDAGVDQARAYLGRRFPDLAAAPLIHSRVCLYENSSNGDFLIDRHPQFDNIWLVGGGSGHGFKHGPAVGRIVAEHILDPSKPIEPRFSLATKQTAANRTIY